MVFTPMDGQEGPLPESMKSILGPHAAAHAVLQAIGMCWMMLPMDQRTVGTLERRIRRIVDGALANLREDDEEPVPGIMKSIGRRPAVDRAVLQAIVVSWTLLPPDQRTVSTVKREIRRIVDRSLANLKEDDRMFGGPREWPGDM